MPALRVHRWQERSISAVEQGTEDCPRRRAKDRRGESSVLGQISDPFRQLLLHTWIQARALNASLALLGEEIPETKHRNRILRLLIHLPFFSNLSPRRGRLDGPGPCSRWRARPAGSRGGGATPSVAGDADCS